MKEKRKNREREQEPKQAKRRNPLRFFGWGALFPVLAEAGIGILLLALPENSLEVLSVSVGVLFCVLGVFLLATAFLLAKAGILRLGAGAVFIGVAVWLFIARREAVTVLLYILLGVLFLRAFLGMWNALMRNKDSVGGHWWQIQFTVCLVVLLGAFVLFFPLLTFTARCIVTGALFAVNAAAGLCSRFARLFSPKLPKGERSKQDPVPPSPREEKGRKRQRREEPEAKQPAPVAEKEETKEGTEEGTEARKTRRFLFRRKKSDASAEEQAKQ